MVLYLTGPPSANIIIDEACITSVTLSLSIYSHSACGGLSHHVNLILSGRAISPVSNNGSTYTFNGLATNTRHNVTVTLINNASDINVFSESVKTLASRRKFSDIVTCLFLCFKFCISAKTYFITYIWLNCSYNGKIWHRMLLHSLVHFDKTLIPPYLLRFVHKAMAYILDLHQIKFHIRTYKSYSYCTYVDDFKTVDIK